MSSSLPNKFRKAGFSLVEVTIALGIMSFCLLAMLGMLPVGLSQERKATDQLLALQALTAVSTDFMALTSTGSETDLYGIKVPKVGEGTESGSFALDENLKKVSGSAVKQYDVSYQIEAPTTAFSSYRMSLRVYRTSLSDPSSEGSADFVESVVLKPVY